MKNLFFLITLFGILFTSCGETSESVKQVEKPKPTETYPKYNDWAQMYEPSFMRKNGAGKLVKVDFLCDRKNTQGFIEKSIKTVFNVVEGNLKSPTSFEPKSVSILKIDGENVVILEYQAVNSFNTLLKGKTTITVTNDGEFNKLVSNS